MLTPEGYKNRIIDKQIDEMMNIYGAVCVEGPKWCGKTWTSRNHAVSAVYIGDPRGNFMNRQLAETDPMLVLNDQKPLLVDEWQVVPALWDAVRYIVDDSGKKGQYVLTGSSTPVMKGKLHGGSGRIGKLQMRTMSLAESGYSTGEVSLMDLFEGSFKPSKTREISLGELIDFTVRGGWPGAQNLTVEESGKIIKDYLSNITDDMERMDGNKRDSRKVMALLRSLGRNESTMTSKTTLSRDVEEYEEDYGQVSVSIDTITDYLNCFNRLFLTEDLPSFGLKLRSSVKALKNPKRHYTDPSLAAAAMNANSETLMKDLNTFGYLFEGLCVRDLRVYSDYYGAKVYHYHDEKNNEVDAIVQLEDGRWGMFEIKVGHNQIERAAAELLNLKNKFESETGQLPQFLCVICGMSNVAYKRADGVYVVPITALGV